MQVLNDWLLTPERVAIHLPSNTAVLADLHWGYAEARCLRGDAVPALPIEQVLAPLERIAQQYTRRVVLAGDVLENRSVRHLVETFLGWLEDKDMELVGVVPGNHDRGAFARGVPCGVPVYPSGMDLGGWRILHGDEEGSERWVVQGHVHPCLAWRLNRTHPVSTQLRAACYLVGDHHLVLPAYSRDASGGNVLRSQRWLNYRACVIVGEKVLDFGEIRGLRARVPR